MSKPPRSVLITGTSSGIGRTAVQEFVQRGWNVAATMRSPEKEKELGRLPGVKVLRLDVTDTNSIDEALATARNEFGRIDAIVNNAGYGLDGVFEAMDDETIQKQFETNVFGLMRVTRAAIPLLRAQGGGSIVQVSSMGGRLTFPLFSIYHSTKWAVEGFSESLQYEVAPFGIRVKLIEPGTIKTEFYGKGRVFVGGDRTEYASLVTTAEKVSQAPRESGVDPAVVARTIVRAAQDQSGRMRYAVGSPAPLLLFLRRVLPERVFYAIVRRSYGI
jgi:NAD(P)-dependent dehydrogenase (short-subunit alcohol dehydrogenase family)